MNKSYEYTIDERGKIIYLPPPIGGPRSLIVRARDYYFRKQFGERFSRVILNGTSWEKHIKTNEVLILEDK